MYLRQRPKSENWASVTPRRSATVCRTKKLSRPRKLPGPWTTTWSKQYLSTVHPVTCSLLWVRCLFDRLSISDFSVPASGLWSGSGSKVDQFVHVPTPVDTQNFIQIHARVLSILAYRQTDKHCGQSHIPHSLSEVNDGATM